MLTHGERQSYQVGNFISNIMFKFSYPYKLRNTRMKWPDVQVSSAAHSLPGTHLRCMQVRQDSSLKRLTPLSIIWFCLHNVFSSTSAQRKLLPPPLPHPRISNTLCCLLWAQERENTGCPFKPESKEERAEEEHKGEAEQSSCLMQRSCWFIHSLSPVFFTSAEHHTESPLSSYYFIFHLTQDFGPC